VLGSAGAAAIESAGVTVAIVGDGTVPGWPAAG
jgi:hypothetical protein